MDTLRSLNNNNSPLRHPDRRNNDSYVFNSIRDGFTDKGLTLTMNSLQQQQLMLAVQPNNME